MIAKGAQALATVTIAETKKSMGRPGKLDVNVDSVRLVDNEKAALSATRNAKGGGHTGAMTAGIVGTAIVSSRRHHCGYLFRAKTSRSLREPRLLRLWRAT